MTKDLEAIESEGYAEAAKIRGQADAEALNTYANAFNKDRILRIQSFARATRKHSPNNRMIVDGKSSEF